MGPAMASAQVGTGAQRGGGTCPRSHRSDRVHTLPLVTWTLKGVLDVIGVNNAATDVSIWMALCTAGIASSGPFQMLNCWVNQCVRVCKTDS